MFVHNNICENFFSLSIVNINTLHANAAMFEYKGDTHIRYIDERFRSHRQNQNLKKKISSLLFILTVV